MFREFWQPQMMLIGYDSFFKKRTTFKGRHEEGVAICYKRDNFQLFKTVDIEFNNVASEYEMPTMVRDRVINDDVGLIAFLQPWAPQYLKSAICFASAMFSDKDDDSDVRGMQSNYLVRCIELANKDFQLPVIVGVSMYDEPSSPAYHVLRTGRLQLVHAAPKKCPVPKVEPLCRGSVRYSFILFNTILFNTAQFVALKI